MNHPHVSKKRNGADSELPPAQQHLYNQIAATRVPVPLTPEAEEDLVAPFDEVAYVMSTHDGTVFGAIAAINETQFIPKHQIVDMHVSNAHWATITVHMVDSTHETFVFHCPPEFIELIEVHRQELANNQFVRFARQNDPFALATNPAAPLYKFIHFKGNLAIDLMERNELASEDARSSATYVYVHAHGRLVHQFIEKYGSWPRVMAHAPIPMPDRAQMEAVWQALAIRKKLPHEVVRQVQSYF